MRYVGLDLAWGRSADTGIAVIDGSGELLELATVRSDAEIMDRMDEWAPGGCVVAVDAPLIVSNETAMRQCERLVGRYFARFGVTCHASNRQNPAFRDGGRASALAEQLSLDSAHDSSSSRRAIEVYTHTAIVQLFGLPRALRYKHRSGRDFVFLRLELSRLLDHIEGLETSNPPLRVRHHVGWQQVRETVASATRKADLKDVEDAVDAIVCAYVALLAHLHRDRVRVLGDSAGYILTPVDAHMAQLIDNDDALLTDGELSRLRAGEPGPLDQR